MQLYISLLVATIVVCSVLSVCHDSTWLALLSSRKYSATLVLEKMDPKFSNGLGDRWCTVTRNAITDRCCDQRQAESMRLRTS
jgi:hypothetical protein